MPARALLERIELELALRRAAPEVEWEPCAREASVLASLPRSSEGLRPDDFSELTHEVVHGLAVIESARFSAIEAKDDDAATIRSASTLIRAWAALGGRGAYLVELARSTGAPLTLAQLAETVSRRGVETVGSALAARVTAGRDLAPLLRPLSHAAAAEATSLNPSLRLLADRRRVDAIEAVLAPLRSVFDDLGARAATEAELVSIFGRVHDAWRRSDRDVELEIMAVERLPDFAWDFYREKRFKELSRIIVPLAEPVTSLAARIERGESAVAWAAPCAQAMVFRAELADRFDQQIELAERAFAICPSLRNARIVLGDFLVTRAERALDRGTARTSNGTTPADDVARAESLFPELKRLPGIRKKLSARSGA